MTTFVAYALTGMLLFAGGLFGLVACAHLLRKIMAANIMAGGVFLFLVSVAHRNADGFPDPVPHAMVLTGVVVALSATALAVALARRVHALTGRSDLAGEETDA